jgi:hypothetical protein
MEAKGSAQRTAGEKVGAVLRLLKGEEASNVAEEAQVPVGELLKWRDVFLLSGTKSLRGEKPGGRKRAAKRSPRKTASMFTLDSLPGIVAFGFESLTTKLSKLMSDWDKKGKW